MSVLLLYRCARLKYSLVDGVVDAQFLEELYFLRAPSGGEDRLGSKPFCELVGSHPYSARACVNEDFGAFLHTADQEQSLESCEERRTEA